MSFSGSKPSRSLAGHLAFSDGDIEVCSGEVEVLRGDVRSLLEEFNSARVLQKGDI